MKTETVKTQPDTAKSTSTRKRITLRLCYAAMGVALMAVCSWISVPFFTIPFTMQTFAVFFVIGLLGTKWGVMAILAYVGLGAAGVPVFAGFAAGVGKLLGPTGGYIVGFVLAALVSGPLLSLAKDNAVWRYLAMIAGLVTCYLLGTLWFMHVSGNFSWQGLSSALMACVVPFVVFDLLKLLLAVFLLHRLQPLLNRSLQ